MADFVEKYINPFTDYGFKKLFGEEINKELLIDFLNCILKEEKVIELQYLRSEQLGSHLFERKAIFDLYCENEKGEKFIVEMQKSKQNFFKDRSVYYSSFPIQQQALRGDWNFELKAIYTIGILDFVFDENKKNKDYYHWEVKLMDVKTKQVFYDKLTYIYLEMPKFNKDIDELESKFDKWLYILKNLPLLHNYPQKLQDKIFDKLFKVAEIAKFTPEDKDNYDESLKVYRDLKNVTETAYDDGVKIGKKEGKLEGKDERSKEIALSLLQMKIPIESIIEVTGLTNEELLKIKKNYKL